MSAAESCLNLDRLCAQYGWEMARQVHDALRNITENHITKSLGVLEEDGLYAFFLYQDSRKSERAGAVRLREQAHELLKSAGIKPFDAVSDSLQAVRGNEITKGLADDLDSLLLAKRLLEQALIYARHHAKALGE